MIDKPWLMAYSGLRIYFDILLSFIVLVVLAFEIDSFLGGASIDDLDLHILMATFFSRTLFENFCKLGYFVQSSPLYFLYIFRLWSDSDPLITVGILSKDRALVSSLEARNFLYFRHIYTFSGGPSSSLILVGNKGF